MCRSIKMPGPGSMAAALAVILALVLPSSEACAQQAEKWVGIEIGGSDVKMVITQVKPGGPDPKGVYAAEPLTTSIGDNMEGNEFCKDAIKRTVEAVREMRDLAKKENHNVPDDHIFVVASGGVAKFKESKTYRELSDEVSKLFLKGRHGLEDITTAEEVGYTFLGVCPAAAPKATRYIDVGGR